MDLTDFIKDLLNIEEGFHVSKIEKVNDSMTILIEVSLIDKRNIFVNNVSHPIYDLAPMRIIQHLPWFEYSCKIQIRLPRYLDRKTNKPVTYTPFFCFQKPAIQEHFIMQ
jgi:transposase